MIEVEGLVSRRGDTTALDGVSLRIDDGESIVIAGANGSGKTTLVRHLNGLLEPDSGSVSVDGTPVLDDPVAARTSVGMVFQNPRDCFVAATVGADVAFGPENLGLPREEIDRRVDDALEAVDLVGHRETRIDRLSGGQQARVAIAGALAMEPDHLVLDEPFTGLDQPSRTTLLRRLDSLSTDGTSLIVVTHDLRDLDALVDRIVVLSSGRIGLEVDATDHERLAEFGVRPC
jgi:biotin transport system ATP-binding protein